MKIGSGYFFVLKIKKHNFVIGVARIDAVVLVVHCIYNTATIVDI